MLGGSCSTCCGGGGGWYCYGEPSCVCPQSSIQSIIVDISCTDYLLHARYSTIGQTWYGSYLSMLSQVNGVHSLARNSTLTDNWEKYFSPSFYNIGGCVYCNTPGLNIRYSNGLLTICTYYAYLSQNEQRVSGLGVQQYFSKGDTVNYGTGSFVFGGASPIQGDTYDPYNPNGPRIWFWNTSASCWRFQSQCVNDVRVWSPVIPSTSVNGVPYDVGLMQASSDKTVVGANTLTINSITFGF